MARKRTILSQQSAGNAEIAKNATPDSTEQRPLSKAAKRAQQIRGAGYRETVESIAVAIILALLFRAFVAEAFVIPTGSMAPALMGAHKDIFCSECGMQYQVSSSIEDRADRTVVGTICSNCRYPYGLDLVAGKADATFSGDRILVSKFAYAISNPARWDVAVFKFPGNPKQNYIKRIVGVPNETLMIHHGDIYSRAGDGAVESAAVADREFEIQRKPPHKLLAMSHHVSDTRHQPKKLNEAGFPSMWQSWERGATKPIEESWVATASDEGMRFEAKAAGDQTQWLRYFHHPATPEQWGTAMRGLTLRDVDPYSSRAVTDFYAYNTFLNVPRRDVYDISPDEAKARVTGASRLFSFLAAPKGRFNSDFKNGDLSQFGQELSIGTYNTADEGMHWVGDLILESDIETSNDAKSLILEIVEAGYRYQCEFNLADGKATMSIIGDEEALFTGGEKHVATVTADTSVIAGSRQTIRFTNADDQLLLWVNGKVVEFDGPTTFDHRDFLSEQDDRPRYTAEHPLDAAPIGIAVQGGSATAHWLRVDRDKYYIATKQSSEGLFDYDMSKYVNNGSGRGPLTSLQEQMVAPKQWDTFAGWDARRTVAFALGEDQFFPMGDNSPESKDARCWVDPRDRFGVPNAPDPYAYYWADKNYVPRDLMVGKAIMVFWPHSWNQPLPVTPNLKRIGLIR